MDLYIIIISVYNGVVNKRQIIVLYRISIYIRRYITFSYGRRLTTFDLTAPKYLPGEHIKYNTRRYLPIFENYTKVNALYVCCIIDWREEYY